MPQLGRFVFPAITVEDAATFLKTITAKISREQFNVAELEAIAGSEISEQFMADLQAYGLLERRGDALQISALGKRVVEVGEGQEHCDALAAAILNTELYHVLIRALGARMPRSDEDLLGALLIVTGATIAAATEHADRITADLKTVFSATLRHAKPTRVRPAPTGVARQQLPGNAMGIVEFRAAEIRYQMPFTPEGLEEMSRILRDERLWVFLHDQAKAVSPRSAEG